MPAHRSFDPRLVGQLECAAWVAYYRREWLRFLRSAVLLTRHTFGLRWGQTFLGRRAPVASATRATQDVYGVKAEARYRRTMTGGGISSACTT